MGLLVAPATAQAATGSDPALSSLSSSPRSAFWFGPAMAQMAYCVTHSADLMLPGKAGYEHCMKYGY
jgi:hypothetical protein